MKEGWKKYRRIESWNLQDLDVWRDYNDDKKITIHQNNDKSG